MASQPFVPPATSSSQESSAPVFSTESGGVLGTARAALLHVSPSDPGYHDAVQALLAATATISLRSEPPASAAALLIQATSQASAHAFPATTAPPPSSAATAATCSPAPLEAMQTLLHGFIASQNEQNARTAAAIASVRAAAAPPNLVPSVVPPPPGYAATPFAPAQPSYATSTFASAPASPQPLHHQPSSLDPAVAQLLASYPPAVCSPQPDFSSSVADMLLDRLAGRPSPPPALEPADLPPAGESPAIIAQRIQAALCGPSGMHAPLAPPLLAALAHAVVRLRYTAPPTAVAPSGWSHPVSSPAQPRLMPRSLPPHLPSIFGSSGPAGITPCGTR